MRLQSLAAILAGSAMTLVLASSPTRAQGTTFVCGQSNGIPATLAKTPQGDVPVILWNSDYFKEFGFDAQKRCELVSQRFQTFNKSGALKYLTTGIINDEKVVCAARNDGSDCARDLPGQGLLFTLKKDSDPGETLKNLLQVRTQASGPIQESSPRVYINMNEFIRDKLKQATTPSSSGVQPSVNKPAQGSGNRIW